jgi:hypothetical protein
VSHKIPFLNSGSELFFTIKPDIPYSHQKGIFFFDPKLYKIFPYYSGILAQITLKQNVYLIMKNNKFFLSPCSCEILYLNDKHPGSINQAYTFISEYLETKRVSHTGNVFQKTYYLNKDKNEFILLDNLRKDIISNEIKSKVKLNK